MKPPCLILACALLILAFVSRGSAAGPSYNVVAIVTDDQAAWTLGCYGGKEIPTPNLDRLAAGGARFANAFVHTPVCSPSRGTYLTGLPGAQLGFTDWLNEKQGKNAGVTPATPTWPLVLTKAGYSTGLIGKWHVGSRELSLPWNNGLQSFTGFLGGGWAPNQTPFINEKGEKINRPGFSVEVCTDLAMEFVSARRDKPFALLVHYREPHAAYVPMPEEDRATARKAELQVPDFPGLRQPYASQARRDYYASIAAIDRNVGRLLRHLEDTGLEGKTIVTFTSDHGYNIGEHGIQHKGNGRWITDDKFHEPAPNMYDSTIRVPMIVRHPGAAKRGLVVEEWVTNADMFASVLGMTGVDAQAAKPPASRDFSPALRGERLPPERFPTELFGQYDLVNYPLKNHMRMIRTEKWKLLVHLNDPARNELYDLAKDPGERENVFGRAGMEAITGELGRRLGRHLVETKDPHLAELPEEWRSARKEG